MSRLRVGFIGAGRIADLHALGYDGNAVCDADGEWAARRGIGPGRPLRSACVPYSRR